MARLAKIVTTYRKLAVLLLNTLVTLVVLNLFALAIVKIAGSLMPTNPVEDKYGKKLLKAYPQLNPQQVTALLAETWSRPVLYEPYTEFRERPFVGQFVNVSALGNRVIPNQAPLPLQPEFYNVFVFGGSTTFGYGVSDGETIPAQLQPELMERLSPKIRVFNFGRGYYFSTQERALFEQLLLSGIKPQAAIFIDGLNEFVLGDGVPAFTPTLSAFMDGSYAEASQQNQRWYADLPAFELLRLLQGHNPNFPTTAIAPATNYSATLLGDPSVFNKQPYLEAVIHRYLENRRMIQAMAGLYGIRTLFVWQPVPTYKYDLAQHIFAEDGFGGHTYSAHGYPLMRQRFEQNLLGFTFLWCADIQENVKKLLYVDLVHYSAELNHMTATCIAKQVAEKKLLYIPK